MRADFWIPFFVLCSVGLGSGARADDEAVCRPDPEGFELNRAGWGPQATLLFDLGRNLVGLKSDEEVDRYIACWNKGSKYEEVYEKKNRKLVKDAERATGVPYPILSCLYFRESIEWNTDIVSPAGAIGLAQLMRETFRTTLGSLNVSENQKLYNTYVAAVGHPPPEMSSRNPEASIFLGALYLKQVYHDLFGDRPPTTDRWIIATGGYNSETSAEKCGKDMTVDQCIAVVRERESHMKRDKHGRVRHENSNHLISIRNCAGAGITKPMAGKHGKTCGS